MQNRRFCNAKQGVLQRAESVVVTQNVGRSEIFTLVFSVFSF